MSNLKITCWHCKEPMRRDADGFRYSHPEENFLGHKESEHYTEDWRCSNNHIAIAWYVDYDPYEHQDETYFAFDGQIDYLDPGNGHTVHQEFRLAE